jgi:hypothetical protein
VGEIEGIEDGRSTGMEYREFVYWGIWAWAKSREKK